MDAACKNHIIMKIQEFKIRTINKLNSLIDQWFDNGVQDGIINGVLKTLIRNNKDKYDQMLNLFVDDKGDVDLSLLHQQLDKTITNDIELELRDIANKLGIPIYLIPNKILYLTKNDVLEILK